MIYLDHAATSPLRESVMQRVQELLHENLFGNPSSQHAFGRKAKTVIEEARRSIATLLACQPAEIIFTSGGTEADNAALSLPLRDMGYRRIITSPLEHHAVLHTAEALAQKQQVPLDLVRVNEQGDVDLEHLEHLLKSGDRAIVSLMHGNNEIGNLLDLQAVGNLVQQYDGLFHSDTVQTIGHQEMDLTALPVDMVSASAHKFNGPKGVGFMYVRSGLGLQPFITGGAQERGMRGGTENVWSIAGMHKALEESYAHLPEEREHLQGIKQYFIQSLREAFPKVVFNGRSAEAERSLFTVLSVSFPHLESDPMLLFNLDIRGIAASGGSACASGSNQGSHVIQAIRPEQDWPTLRFSFGLDNTRAEIDQAVDALEEIMSGQVKG